MGSELQFGHPESIRMLHDLVEGQQPVSIAIVGVGAIAETVHIPILAALPGVHVSILIDPYAPEERLRRLAKRLGCRWQRGLDSLGAEFAIVATPISKHFEVAMELLAQKVHVFVEKPLVPFTTQAEQLISLSQSNCARLFCGQVRRLYENTNIAKVAIESGIVGDLRHIAVYEGNLYGWKRRFFSKERDKNISIDEGVLFDVGSHGLDTVMYVLQHFAPELQVQRSVTDDVELQSNIDVTGTIDLRTKSTLVSFSARFSNTVGLANVIWFLGTHGKVALFPNATIMPRFFPNSSSIPLVIGQTINHSVSPFVLQLARAITSIHIGNPTEIDSTLMLPTVSALQAISENLVLAELSWSKPFLSVS